MNLTDSDRLDLIYTESDKAISVLSQLANTFFSNQKPDMESISCSWHDLCNLVEITYSQLKNIQSIAKVS